MRYRFTLNNDTLGPLVLPLNPGGWKDMSILMSRSPKYHGVVLNQTANLEFFCGSGKEYLDNAKALGIDTLVTLLIESECAEGDGFEEEYTGRISLKTWSTINGRSTADIIEDTIADTVLNRMDTPIDLTKPETLDGTPVTPFAFGPYEMDLHSKQIVFLSELSNLEDTIDFDNFIAADLFPPSTNRLAIALPLAISKDELDTISQYDTFLVAGDPYTASFPDTLYQAFEGGEYIIDYNFIGDVREVYAQDRTYSFRFGYRINEVGFDIDNVGPATYGANITQIFPLNYTGTLTLNLNAGDTFSIFTYIDNYDSTGSSLMSVSCFLESESYIKITKNTVTPGTTANVHAIFEAGAAIFRAYADQVDAFRSEYYGRKNSQPFSYSSNGCGSFRSITNGSLIRNFPITERPVRITGNEFFDSLNAIDNIGMGIERVSGIDYVRFEPKSHFYSDTLLFQLSNVPDMKISVAPEYYYNRFECGYEKWQIEQRGGLDEINSKRQYDLGLKTIDNPLVQISTMIAGGYPLEIARRKQYPDSFTEDFDTDNDDFIICLNRSVDGDGVPNNLTTAEKDENFSSVTNVLSPETSYNLRISPGRNALRWSPVLNVGLLAYPGRNMKFTYGEGNFKMTSEFSADTCPGRWNNNEFSEGQDIQWDDSDNTDNAPLWIPEINTFKFPLTRAQFNILRNNPYGYIEVSDRSTVYDKWYILEAKYTPVGGMTEFKLLKKWQ